MPKKPVNYSNTSFYRIVCKDTTIKNSYVGHTTNLRARRNEHKSRCNNPDKYTAPVYNFIRANGNFENWSIIEIENIKCNNFEDALKRERYWLEQYKADLNYTVPTRTFKECYEVNCEKYKQKRKEWINNNKDKIKEKYKNYYENNKEIINEKNKLYREKQNKEDIIEYRKKYRNENKDMLKEFHKNYYENNKEKLIERQQQYYNKNKEKQPFNCDCGSVIRNDGKTSHLKTKKHLAFLESIKSQPVNKNISINI